MKGFSESSKFSAGHCKRMQAVSRSFSSLCNCQMFTLWLLTLGKVQEADLSYNVILASEAFYKVGGFSCAFVCVCGLPSRWPVVLLDLCAIWSWNNQQIFNKGWRGSCQVKVCF